MRWATLILIIFIASTSHVKAQNQEIYNLFLKFERLYSTGDLFNAEKCMLLVLDSKESIPEQYLVSVYINLGVINNLLGRYKESLEYNNRAEALIRQNKLSFKLLADIYSNKARTYNLQKSFSYSIEFLEKAIRIYLDINNPDKSVLYSLSAAYQNLGICYYGRKDYKTALEYFERSAELKLKYNLSKIALAYLNIANIYRETGDSIQAEKFFLKCIEEFTREFGENYYRIVDVFFDYGLFLRSTGRETEALEYHKKALTICLKNYGEKHPYVSLAYKYIGDHYTNQSDYISALQYYQKALIALVRDFDNLDMNTNPSLDSALSDVDFLKILQKKSEVLEQLSLQQKNPELSRQTMTKSLETIELALQLIHRIRNDYTSGESRLYLMDNEKETYIFATHITRNLYTLTGDPAYLQKMYMIAKQAKSAILHNEITDNELFYSIGIPDTLIQKHKRTLGDIGAFNNLIHEEVQNAHPDNKKINFWKDALFEMSREKERMEDEINKQFPQYRNLLQKTEPVSLEEIQSHLKRNETLIEYFLSNKYTGGKRKLYLFAVTKDSLHFRESFLDTLFVHYVETIKHSTQQDQSTRDQLVNYRKYTSALFNLYDKLIKPVENNLTGSKLIIIPDEEIAYLPFDAFIKSKPDSDQINYEGLQYLIKSYTISYGYSSSLIFTRDKKKINSVVVCAFSPDYRNSSVNSGKGYESLHGTRKEINAIYKWFNGEEFLGEQATESNFKSIIQYPAILHLAMHSLPDTGNSKYSHLIFDTQRDTMEDGNLYNYEISLSRIKTPMVVLSACNTGTGTLYHGEGVMSMTRAFILAGASSVIKTLWDVNDDASAKIISAFYYHLSKGKEKDVALRLAKLEYLKASSPTYTDPYYWAAYQVMGDKSFIVNSNKAGLFIIFMIILILGGGIWMGYFKRRRSFLARS